jgi:hypothetical protein
MDTLLQKGDLVRGKKPWNKSTIIGVVVEHNEKATMSEKTGQETNQSGTFRIFWLNDASKNEFTSKGTFSTWEVLDSLERIDNDKETN